MSIFSILILIIFMAYLIGLLIILKKSKETLKIIFIQAAISLTVMTIINLTGSVTDLHIPVNECTVVGVGLGGIPFMIGFIILRVIFVL